MNTINETQIQELIKQAKAASEKAYAPYSGFRVGAALLTSSGKTYLGCNVENASYSLTICAERNTVFQAVAEGEKDFLAIAVYAESELAFPPCGACRQVLAEFAPEIHVIFANQTEVKQTDLASLLPQRFSLPNE
jgi:cytidine deaminase